MSGWAAKKHNQNVLEPPGRPPQGMEEGEGAAPRRKGGREQGRKAAMAEGVGAEAPRVAEASGAAAIASEGGVAGASA